MTADTTLLTLATSVTLGGLVIVAWAAHLVSRFAPVRTRLLAGVLLLIYGAVVILRPSAWPVIDLAVLIGAVGAAVFIGGSLSSSGAVVAFLVAAAAVDILSVSGGFSRVIIERYQNGTSDLLLYLTLVVPIGGRLIPIVGISDLLVGGSSATALVRLGLRPVAVMGAIAVGLLGALAYGLWRGGAPALPFLAVPVYLLVWRNSSGSTRHVNGASTP